MICRFCHNKITKSGSNWRTEKPGYLNLYYNCKRKFEKNLRPDELDAAPHEPMENLELLEYKHEHKEN